MGMAAERGARAARSYPLGAQAAGRMPVGVCEESEAKVSSKAFAMLSGPGMPQAAAASWARPQCLVGGAEAMR